MSQLIKLSLSLLLGLAVAQPALAKGPKNQPDPKEHDSEAGEGPAHGFKEALKSLNLSDEQKSKIKELRKSGKEAHKELRTSLQEGRKAMEELMKSEAKTDAILLKFDSLQTLRNKMDRARFEMMLSVREILTPEQRQKFRGFMDSHKGRRGGGGGRDRDKGQEPD